MRSGSDPFSAVLALARRACVAQPQGEETPSVDLLPPGFAARVAAIWAGSPAVSGWELWERVSRWGVVVGLAVCAVAFFLRSERALPVPSSTPFDQFVLGSAAEERS